MPKPPARTPRAGSTAEDTSADLSPASLAPAPDNGVPFAEQNRQSSPADARPPVHRRGKQLGMRIPDELYARMTRCVEEAPVYTKSSLLAHALDEKLKALGY